MSAVRWRCSSWPAARRQMIRRGPRKPVGSTEPGNLQRSSSTNIGLGRKVMKAATADLALQLVRLAHGYIEPGAYREAHRSTLRRILISQCEDPAIQPFIPRLLHYCLECGVEVQAIVKLTFRYITCDCDGEELSRKREEFIRQLELESEVLDRLNSVPWPFGIRTRRGSDTQLLTPIIKPNVPIDPNQKIAGLFKTSCANQTHARIELYAGSTVGSRTDGAVPVLARRVKLPGKLPLGTAVEIILQRVEAAVLRIEMHIQREGILRSWWWIEDSEGFSELAAEVLQRIPERCRDIPLPARNVRLLVQSCIHFLHQSWQLLSEESRVRMVDWVQQTSTALVLRNEDGLK